MAGGNARVEIDADIIRVSRNADDSVKSYLVSDGDTEAWIPAQYFEEVEDGVISIPEWLAIDRGLV